MKILTKDEILNVDDSKLPLLVLSDSIFSWVSFRIKMHEHGYYNHMMWMHKRGFFASQDMTFNEVPVEKYLEGGHRMKFWTNEKWNTVQRYKIINAITNDLKRKKIKSVYDILQIIGIAIGLRKLQTPGLKICSDYADYLAIVDPEWKVNKHNSPPQVNRWLEKKRLSNFWEVYSRLKKTLSLILILCFIGCAYSKIELKKYNNNHIQVEQWGVIADTKTTWDDNETLLSFTTTSKDKPEENFFIKALRYLTKFFKAEISPEIK